MNLNKAHLIGRVTKDPELKTLPNGTAVVKFGLATNNVFKSKTGEKKESTQFHNCVAFGRTAEVIGQFVVKGQEIYIEGRIEYRQWDKKDGGKGYQTEIMVESMQMGQKAKGSVGNDQADGNPPTPVTEIEPEEINPEDLPF